MTIPNLAEFVDDHEEQHAVATGFGVGFSAAVSGDLRAFGVAATIGVRALETSGRPEAKPIQDLRNDIQREPHYFLAAIALGGIVGYLVRYL